MRNLDINQNILHFERLLEAETDPASRVNLLNLLLNELDKLDRYGMVHLVEIERQIANNDKFIATHRALATRLNGNDTKVAETLLQTMFHTQALCKMYRERIAQELRT